MLDRIHEETWRLVAMYDERQRDRRRTAVERRHARIQDLSKVLCGKRDEAIKYRATSGIEQRWRESEERYAGIDDANRGLMHKSGHFTKSMTLDGPMTESKGGGGGRSVVFPRMTARNVDAVFAKVCEMILAPGERSFAIEPTPVPELAELQHNETQVAMDGQPLTKPATPPPPVPPPTPGIAPPPGMGAPDPNAAPPEAPREPLTVKDLVEEYLAEARKRCKKAERRIYDWMVESNFASSMEMLVFDLIRLGVGVLKGPFPQTYRRRRVNRDKLKGPHAAIELTVTEEVRPTYRQVSPWNFFPDPACGNNPKDGDHCFERVFMSPKQVRDLQRQDDYILPMINKVLKEGAKPSRATGSEQAQLHEGSNDKQFEAWYCYCSLTIEDFAILNPVMAKKLTDDEDEAAHLKELNVVATVVNDTIVFATPQPVGAGTIPYHTCPFIFLEGSWAGESLPERLDVPQRILVAATRAMMNNAGVSSGSQIIMERNGLVPANGSHEVEPDKIWYRTHEATSEDVRKLFMSVDIPNKTKELMLVVDYAFRLAEESSNLPLISQGFAGKESPETLGASQMQNSNAAQMLRSIARGIDKNIMEPVVTMSYEWLMVDPDVPDDEKGDAVVQAHGSSALVERALQDQFMIMLVNVVAAQPDAYDADLKKFFVELLRSRGLDPASYKLSEEDKANRPAPPPPPQVMAAQIREQGAMAREQLRMQQEMQVSQAEQAAAQQMAQLEQQIEAERLRVDTEANAMEREYKLKELDLKKQIFVARYANDRGMSEQDAKLNLAITAMKLKVQRELALLKTGTEVLQPATEPPGKASNNQSFVA